MALGLGVDNTSSIFFNIFLLWFSELQVVKDRLQGSGVLHMGSRLPLSGKHTLGVASPGEGSKARVSDGGGLLPLYEGLATNWARRL